MKRMGTLLVVVGGLCILAGASLRDVLHFPLHGFSIAPLEARTVGTTSVLMTMMLPASDKFAPNVNVVAQNWPGTLESYIAVSKSQFTQSGFKVIQLAKPDASTVVFEYSGDFHNRPLHWYAKASLRSGEVLLATATATEQQWPANRAQLEACVNSFHRDAL